MHICFVFHFAEAFKKTKYFREKFRGNKYLCKNLPNSEIIKIFSQQWSICLICCRQFCLFLITLKGKSTFFNFRENFHHFHVVSQRIFTKAKEILMKQRNNEKTALEHLNIYFKVCIKLKNFSGSLVRPRKSKNYSI